MITLRLECEAHMHEERESDEEIYIRILLSEFEIVSEKTLTCNKKHINTEEVHTILIYV